MSSRSRSPRGARHEYSEDKLSKYILANTGSGPPSQPDRSHANNRRRIGSHHHLRGEEKQERYSLV
jgi:hypothetical protein